MNLSELFIKRPVTTTLLMLGMLVFGTMAYRMLPVSDLPTIDYPTIQVSASLPGASPETMASAVALPLEKQFATIQGLESISSSSSMGSTQISLTFALDRNIDAAAQDVQSMISRTTRQLPTQMPSPPSYRKVNPSDSPVLNLVVYSDTLPLATVDEYAESTIAQRLSMVAGVAQVQVYGSAKYAVHIDVDPSKLAAHQIGMDDLATAIQNANVNLPTGTLYGSEKTYVLQANGQLLQASAYGPITVAYRKGNPVHLSEIAHVYDGVENPYNAAWYHGQRVVYLSIQKQPGTNVVAVVDAVKAMLPTFREQLPASLHVDMRSDRSVSIRESVNDVKTSMLLAFGLVVGVIFIFLRNVSATVIPTVALPASIVATFAIMYMLDYSVDNLSLMALTLSIGFVVDNVIVMLENIVRHEELGKSPMRAALEGSREVSFTIVAMTAALVAVFIPVLFMGGIVGRLLREFSVTISVAILISGLVAISLTPMLCSRFLAAQSGRKHGFFFNATERMFDGLLWVYKVTLRGTLRFRAVTALVSVALIVGTGYLFVQIPKGFLPSEDQSRLTVTTEAIQGIGFDEMVRHQMEVNDVLSRDPNVQDFQASIGGQGGSLNSGRVMIDLKPRAERPLGIDEVIATLRPKLAQVPGVRVYMTNPPPINLGGQYGARSQYQFTMRDTDTTQLYEWAPRFQATMAEIPGVVDLSSDMQLNNPQIWVQMNRDRISSLGLTVNQVETALYNSYGTRQVSQIYAPNNQYQVILGVAPEHQQTPTPLSRLYVRAPNSALLTMGTANQFVPLETVAQTSTQVGPTTVAHTGQLPSVTFSFNLAPGYALGDVVSAIQAAAATTLPSSIATSFQGAAQMFQDSLQGLGLILAMAIVVIYIVLGVLYESFSHPFTILSGLPAAAFGALVTLMFFQMDLSLYAFVGIIMLIGLVMKNGIMMVDFALQAQARGKSHNEAIQEACLVRFRPIMMTTLAALAGALPIALGLGAGAESRRPLGLAVVGGLAISQLLTLYITPVYYSYIEGGRQVLIRRKAARVGATEAVEDAARV